jgi:hypothetical protein
LVSLTILIAAASQLAALKQRAEFIDAEAFADTEAIKALEAITRQRPQVIALDQQFAATSRGAAFINRVKADPALAASELRIVQADISVAREAVPVAAPAPAPVAAPATAPAAAPAAATPDTTTAPVTTVVTPASSAPPTTTSGPPAPAVKLDQTGTRRAERHVVNKSIEVLIDGNPATLVNISLVGAQVLSASLLRPNQRIRMSLVDATRPMRFNGVVAWANFEMPKEGPRYRAGVNFYDAAPDMVARFIETITAS